MKKSRKITLPRAPKGKILHAVDFGPGRGVEGETRFFQVCPQLLFKGERLVATDTLDGQGTQIYGIYINNVLCFPLTKRSWWVRALTWLRFRKVQRTFVSTVCFGASILGNEFSLPTCMPDALIQIEVKYLADCEWRGKLFGRAVL